MHSISSSIGAGGTIPDGSTISLTLPAEVSHKHNNNVRQELLPQLYEGGVANWSHKLCCSLLVELPHMALGCVAEEKLNVSTLISRNLSWKNQPLYECKVSFA